MTRLADLAEKVKAAFPDREVIVEDNVRDGFHRTNLRVHVDGSLVTLSWSHTDETNWRGDAENDAVVAAFAKAIRAEVTRPEKISLRMRRAA